MGALGICALDGREGRFFDQLAKREQSRRIAQSELIFCCPRLPTNTASGEAWSRRNRLVCPTRLFS